MLITLSSTGTSPYRFTNMIREPIVIKKDSKVALLSAYLNVKREIQLPASDFFIRIGDGDTTIPIPAQTFTDATPFTTWLTNVINGTFPNSTE